MIKINLAPRDVTESHILWEALPEIVVIVLVSMVTYFGADLYLSNEQIFIEQSVGTLEQLNQANQIMEQKNSEFKKLDEQLKLIKSKGFSIFEIASSNTQRYRALIVMEHLQTLKPEGVWLNEISFSRSPEREKDYNNERTLEKIKKFQISKKPFKHQEVDLYDIKISGFSYDNLLLAEFISNLKSTQLTNYIESDIRANIYFKDIKLVSSIQVPAKATAGVVFKGNGNLDTTERMANDFTLTMKIGEKERTEQPMNISFNSDVDTGVVSKL